MALDFTQIDNEGTIISNVPIGIEMHANVFDTMELDKYPFLERIRDYYSDIIYSVEDLPGLKKDLVNLRKRHSYNPLNLKLIDSMIMLIEDSILNEFRIETIAD